MPSDLPLPQETGPNSIDSSTSSPEEAVQEAMELSAGVTRLGRMAGVASIDRNLAVEDAAYKRDMEGDSAQAATGDEMRIMAARDVYVNPEVKASPPLPRKSAGILAKATLGAALLGSGAGAATAIPWMFDALKPPMVEMPDEVDEAEKGIGLELEVRRAE